jgi:hypothetical protein
MSQVETASKSKWHQRRERADAFVRSFEWNWTTSVLCALGITFFLLISVAVIPSFWLYFADQKLKWDGSGPNGLWLKVLRDAVAMGLSTGPIITVLVVASVMQNWRRKLRSQADSRPTGGYR